LLNASVGFQRVLGRVRRPLNDRPASDAPREARRYAIAPKVRHGVRSVVAASRLVPIREHRAAVVVENPVVVASVAAPVEHRRSLISRLGPDRTVAVAVAAILVGASVISVSAGNPGGATGGTSGAGVAPRIAVGGGLTDSGGTTGSIGTTGNTGGTTGTGGTGSGDDVLAAGGSSDSTDSGSTESTGSVEFGQPAVVTKSTSPFAAIDFGDVEISASDAAAVEGPFIDDGTLIKPTAVDTTVPDGSGLVRTYKVKKGDKLGEIATEFKVSPMTIVWANNLKSKTDFKKGDTLRIPPVTGLIVKVAAADTLESIASRYGVEGTDILVTNGIDDPNLVIGQVLVLPGAKGKAIPKPTIKPSTGIRLRDGGGPIVKNVPSTYSGGKFMFPVVGGDNYVSQYFRYGHYAIDIAGDYGSTVRSAAAGTVIFAGWKSNGGGYQVWVAHGSGLYTTYNHMSAISVGRGQEIGRGKAVGRIGQSGNASGPHLHFEVWRGPVWNGGQRVNPLGYL
jgi:murein DD-endopeptidase MepM/ murein hydrolase activator NlpD